MKSPTSFSIIFAVLFFSQLINAQDIEVEANELFLYEDTLGIEMVFDFIVINVSSQEQTVFEVRTLDSLASPNWFSSLCIGDFCFAPGEDSIATTPPLFEPLQPNDTLITSLHVTSDVNTIGTSYFQLQIGTFRNPDDRIILDFIATTDPSVSVDEDINLNSYYLFQNYPNPFNPSTNISYKISEAGMVRLKVFNILGVEVATLVNEFQYSGEHSVDFNSSGLSSGVYFYSLSVNNFTQTRKMILEK
jgi:hypothetical protein